MYIGFNILSPLRKKKSWIGSNPEPSKDFKICERILTDIPILKSSNLVFQWEFSKKPSRILKEFLYQLLFVFESRISSELLEILY